MAVTIGDVRTQIADLPQLWPPQAQPPELLGYTDGVQTIYAVRFPNTIPGTLTVYTATPPAAGTNRRPRWIALSAAPPVAISTTSETAVTGAGTWPITPASMTNIAAGVALVVDAAPNQETVIVSAAGDGTFTATFALAHPSGFAIQGAPTYAVGAPNQNANSTLASNAIVTFAQALDAGTMIGARAQACAFADCDLQGYLSRAQALYPDDLSVLKRVLYDIIDVLLVDRSRLVMLAQGDYREDPAAYADSLKATKAELRADLEGGPLAGAATPQLFIGGTVMRQYQPWK